VRLSGCLPLRCKICSLCLAVCRLDARSAACAPEISQLISQSGYASLLGMCVGLHAGIGDHQPFLSTSCWGDWCWLGFSQPCQPTYISSAFQAPTARHREEIFYPSSNLELRVLPYNSAPIPRFIKMGSQTSTSLADFIMVREF
jgi:hypothetical protein